MTNFYVSQDLKTNTVIKYYTFLIVGFLLSSCATLIHQRTVDLNVYSDTDSVKICLYNDTTRWFNTPTWINVERSRNDLLLFAKKDSIQKLIQINSRLSTAFWLGNMFSGGIFGYAIDLSNPKRFTYPPNITIDFSNSNLSSKKYRTWLTPEKGLVAIKISIPEGNHFYLNKGNGYGNTFGFIGISGGIEYYYSNKFCVNLELGALTDFMVPFPAPIDYQGSYQRSFATYGDIQLGSDYKRLHYDFGLQFTRTSHYVRETVELFPVYIDTLKYFKIQNNLGFAFSTYYRISNGFNLGLNYYPSFAAWDKTEFKIHYTHLIFFEFTFRIEAFRPRKKK